MYIWQSNNWPSFNWDDKKIQESLLLTKKSQGYILGVNSLFNQKELGEIITTEASTTSAIAKHTDGLVELLLDAIRNYNVLLTEDRLFAWHAALFPTGFSGMTKIEVGCWRSSKIPMQVISGSLGKEKVHYVAPESEFMVKELDDFFSWWSSSITEIDGLIRADSERFWRYYRVVKLVF
ncbi:MAG: DUF4172 domain-containing protein [Spirochaetaceae bacterium]